MGGGGSREKTIEASAGGAKEDGGVMRGDDKKHTGMSIHIPASHMGEVELFAELEKRASYDEIEGELEAQREVGLDGVIG